MDHLLARKKSLRSKQSEAGFTIPGMKGRGKPRVPLIRVHIMRLCLLPRAAL